MNPEQNVLVLCARNSARSQMTEAFLSKLGGDRFRIFSAGLAASEIHPLTHRVMEEVGIPLTGHHSKSTRDFLGKLAVHHLIIVYERTERECPKLFLGAVRRHSWPFPDPVEVEGSTNAKPRNSSGSSLRWVFDPTTPLTITSTPTSSACSRSRAKASPQLEPRSSTLNDSTSRISAAASATAESSPHDATKGAGSKRLTWA